MEDFKKRLVVEKKELFGRIEKLQAFLNSDKSNALDSIQSVLLGSQLSAMTLYLTFLSLRMASLGIKGEDEDVCD